MTKTPLPTLFTAIVQFVISVAAMAFFGLTALGAQK